MPQQDLTCTLIQQPLLWQDPTGNRRRLGDLIENLQGATDLIILPEMFTAGFSLEVEEFAEPEDGATLHWMADMASSSGAVITGSYAVMQDGYAVNRLVWMRPDGSSDSYDKRHLFRMAGEHERYRAGREKLLVELRDWRVCPLVCYDLRFPVWCRNQEDYDLLIFVANWPAARASHWTTLLQARAIENLACVAGVNRVGEDGRGHKYSGQSVLLDARGRALLTPGDAEGVFTAVLSAEHLNSYREGFPAHMDADRFQLL